MKINFIQHFSLLLLLLATINAASSTIEGTITDVQSGYHLMGANVMLDGTMLGAASDENGYYLITNVPIGNYTVKAMFIGYESIEKEVRVEADAEYIIDIALEPTAIELQETKVTGEKRKEKITSAPASMEIVTSRDLRGKTTTNIGAYLKGLKGIDFTSSGINNYSISVRGFNSSFNTRLLTLSDGRVANIPALRVINYSTIPQSMDDVDKIEVILGPATALYGANAHSGVVNILSKPPSQSEGFSMSLSGSNDVRQLRKINGRFAKKLTNTISIKVSGLYLHAYDWPFISEEEYKAHLYPWSLTPYRTIDGKDNNPWNVEGTEDQLIWDWAVHDLDGDGVFTDSAYVRIGNGEAMDTGDPDGDGVMGEDWFNGYDDDGDGLIDEDYFEADGVDNGGIPCTGDSNNDGCYCCSGDYGVDENIDGIYDLGFDGVDNDHNGIIDDEAGDAVIDSNIKEWGRNIENNILIEFGRRDSLINGEINPYYIPNLDWEGNGTHLFGNHRYNEEKVTLEFDIFTYDFGEDGLPGDPFNDESGDGEYQMGESEGLDGNFNRYLEDCGLDGICEYLTMPYDLDGDGYFEFGDLNPDWPGPDSDGTERDDVMQAGDTFISDDGDGIWEEHEYIDVWPPANGIWDEGEDVLGDYGQDGIADTGDPGEGDGIFIAWDSGENDGVFETGDGLYAFSGEPFSDDNGNGIKDPNESFTDTNSDGLYNAPDLLDDFQVVLDTNGDAMNDYPDFEIDNRKVEFRIDYDPNPDFNMTLQTGYSWTKTNQVTGTGRYIADGFEYKFYQIRSRYKNWFSQFYMNESFSGDTRGYNLGNRIIDKSKNYALQIQNNFNLKSMNTKFVWGMDYFRTDPFTNGTIINDGPNGYDNDGDNVIIGYNGFDEDGDGTPDDPYCPDGQTSSFRNGKLWSCGEGIDEPDEFIDPQSNEYGIYYQTSTELFGTSRYEFITAARLDYHDLLDEGLLFAPKLGFIYKPDSKSSMRFTYGKAYNTPNSISLFTDLFVGKSSVFEVYLRGNYDGTAYCRVGLPCLGENYPTSVATPGFYGEDNSTFYTFGPSDNITYFSGITNENGSGFSCSNDNFLNEESCEFAGHNWIINESGWEELPYSFRVDGAPYYFQFDGNDLFSGDNIPLDTSKNVIFVPELNGDGVLYTAKESMNIPDVDPIRTEKIQTVEFGYKGFLGNRTHFSLDYYLSYYEDFFSPPTIITPLIVSRKFDEDGNDITDIDDLDVQGIMTINDAATYPPYATAFNGIDDNGDWAEWADVFGWDQDDKNGDGDLSDPGEWGFVVYDYDGVDTAFFHPWEVMQNENGFPKYQVSGVGSYIYDRHGLGYTTVGVDEWIEFGALREIENVEGATSIDGEDLPIGVTAAPYHLVLSPMNYGEVWMQGLDFGLTHFLTEKIILDGNVSWYGTTEFYNELTKKNDPINAPKWKWNASIKGKYGLSDFIINFRHVDQFQWSDGIWAGLIGPYNIIDLFYTYHITKNLDINISALNLTNDLHKELVGGAVMGRQIVMRFTSTF